MGPDNGWPPTKNNSFFYFLSNKKIGLAPRSQIKELELTFFRNEQKHDSIMSQLSEVLQSLKISQIYKLVQLGEYGRETKEVLETNSSVFSREIAGLEKAIGVDLTRFANGETELTVEGKLFVDLFGPFIQLFQRVEGGEIANLRRSHIRIGAGGSLTTWLIGARLPEVKTTIRNRDGDPETAHRLHLDVQAYRNRDIMLQVVSNSLDCGLVRKGVLGILPQDRPDRFKHPRLQVDALFLGTIRYCLYLPKSWIPEAAGNNSSKPLEWEFERSFLSGMPLATVGPHGEFRRTLDAAFYDRNLFPNIEYSYRAFPMLLPHMRMSTHAIIMPDIRQLEGNSKDTSELSTYQKFPLGILEGYTRDIYLAYSRDHERRVPELNIGAIRDVLRF